jgi:hypothetical protein
MPTPLAHRAFVTRDGYSGVGAGARRRSCDAQEKTLAGVRRVIDRTIEIGVGVDDR